MERYVRLKNGKIIDTFQQKGVLEGFNDKEYYYVQLSPLFCVEDIVAQSADIIDLIMVGDLIRIEFIADDYDYREGTIILDEFSECMETVKDDIKDNYIDLLELYTKQGNDYVLVWNKERGVIEL